MNPLDLDDLRAMPHDAEIRIHWEGSYDPAIKTTPLNVLGDLADGDFTEDEFNLYAAVCTEQDYQAEQAQA